MSDVLRQLSFNPFCKVFMEQAITRKKRHEGANFNTMVRLSHWPCHYVVPRSSFDLFDVFIYEQGSVQVLYVYVFPSKKLREFASYYIISFRMSSGATCTMLQSLARP